MIYRLYGGIMSRKDIIEKLMETCKYDVDYAYVIEEILDRACSELTNNGFNLLKANIKNILDNYE